MHAIKVYGGVWVQLHSFFKSVLGLGPGRFNPEAKKVIFSCPSHECVWGCGVEV